MNWLDLFIVLFLLAAVLRGREVGFVRQICSGIGVVLGLVAGAWVNGLFISHFRTAESRAIFALLATLGGAALLMLAGEYLGLLLKFRIREGRLTNHLDRWLGSALAAATLLAAVWLGTAIFRNLPSNAWQRQIRTSRIVAVLNRELPPAPAVMTRLGHLLDPNGFPQVFAGLERALPSDEPLPNMGQLTAAVQRDRAATVKVEGEGCGGVVQGSGFVASGDEVVTNAHVVAGVARPFVLDSAGRHRATVVLFDANLDVAILRVDNLQAAPLALSTARVDKGTAAALLGYPGGRGFSADPAVILEAFTAVGRNIYNQGHTERSVYSLKGDVEQGNSGGPLIDVNGNVLGLIFAKSTSYDQVGYALTSDQVASALATADQRSTAVSTGVCAE